MNTEVESVIHSSRAHVRERVNEKRDEKPTNNKRLKKSFGHALHHFRKRSTAKLACSRKGDKSSGRTINGSVDMTHHGQL